MKHLKTFEDIGDKINNLSDIPNYTVGDIVVCIFDSGGGGVLVKGKKYLIEDISYDNDVFYCHVKGLSKEFYCNRFVSEKEYDAMKYNL